MENLREYWKQLKERYQIQTIRNKLELIQVFKNRYLQENEDPDVWIMELELLKNRLLIEHSEVISDEEFQLTIINGLRPKNMKTSKNVLNTTFLTMEEK